ncbi:bifunctional UDP-sugar hydrolase/5'-nucleotidase UshA [bacterium]|nr:bifunctional UDP-sugar hydrolase/5'-nucleotidase UshA [bacterium]
MKKILSFMLIAALAIFMGCTTTQPIKRDIDAKLTILHTNDHHGHFWKNSNGEYGLAAQKTLVDRIRSEVKAGGGQVLLLSAGDINTGIPVSDLQDAEPDFKAMSLIGYDAMAIGNHEFDNPLDVLAKQKQWVNFPFLGANIINKDTGKPLYDAYKIFDLNGLKVAVFGLITQETPLLVTPDYVKSIEFRDPIEVAKELVPELRKQAHVVIALSHMGFYEGGNYGTNAPGDVTLAKSVPGIDVIVGGHTHAAFQQSVKVNHTIIVQANDWGKYIGRLDLALDKGALSEESFRMIPVNLKKKVEKDGETVRVFIEEEIPEDAEVLALLAPFQEKGKAELDKVIGSTTGDFVGERAIVRSQETNLGNLIAKAQRLKTGADVGVISGGGIRTSISKGDITYNDVLKVQPFSNSICVVTLSGAELKKYLEIAANKTPGSGAFAQFDNVVIRMSGESLVSIEVGGKAVVDDGQYKLATNGFAAAGGDGYMRISDHPAFVDTGFVDADVLREYISKNSPLNPDDYAPTNDVIR